MNGMSVTIHLDLPEALVKEAEANGLLESRRLGEMLNEELRRERARQDLGRMLKDLHSLPGEPMSPEEIQAEIDAVRAQRRHPSLSSGVIRPAPTSSGQSSRA
jgi:aminoglycoside phosphotransferase (APT) family kinase protein